ncbi:peptidase M20 [Actinocatenispora thailandica]|uniref:Peptidase M20 n=1 Tax=Actinocatenispora thailandica TaxID=227318 RepID=A0A7R7DQH1_9ACTN|nr:M20/M25/M40 family metallo-hydrolase [Actinocatenispora thailandica]BCJ35877.1 peptidase M20 [Actinocatenispora thailandica]
MGERIEDDELLAVADRLLAVESTAAHPDALHAALDLVLGLLGPGVTVERFASGGRPSALVYRPAPRRPTFRVLLNAHLDVLPGSPDQFVPRRVGDRLYARGAQDMKVTALALALAFRELADVLPYPLGLQLVTDEELGGYHGTAHQVAQGVRAGFAIVGEFSGLELVTESKGIADVTLTAVGRAAHGAYPWLGDNAVLRLVRAVERLLAEYPPPAEPVWRATVNLAAIETADTAINQVPAQAQARLDIRYPPEDTRFAGRAPDEVVAALVELVGPDVAVRLDRFDPPHRADEGSMEVRALRDAVRAEGYPGGFLRKHGAADSRHLAAVGIPAVAFGIDGDGQHGPAEYADLATLGPYRRALRRFLLAVAP